MISDQDYELLSAYLDDALPGEARAVLEARLAREAALRRELDALRATVDLIGGLPELKAPRNFTLDADMARRPAQRWLIFPTTAAFSALSAAAAFVLVALAVALSALNAAAPRAAQLAFESTRAVEGQEAAAQITQAAPPAMPEAQQMTMPIQATAADFVTGEALLFAAPPGAEDAAAEAGVSAMSAAVTAEPFAASADAALSAPAESPTFDALSADAAPAAAMLESLPATPSPAVERAQPDPTAPGDLLPLFLLLTGGALAALALITTLIRRRA